MAESSAIETIANIIVTMCQSGEMKLSLENQIWNVSASSRNGLFLLNLHFIQTNLGSVLENWNIQSMQFFQYLVKFDANERI